MREEKLTAETDNQQNQPVPAMLMSRSAKPSIHSSHQGLPFLEANDLREKYSDQNWKSSTHYRPFILSGRVSRPLASYYHSSSFLPLYSAFNGDIAPNATTSRPHTTMSKQVLLSSYRPIDQAMTSKGRNANQRLPTAIYSWRSWTNETSRGFEEKNSKNQKFETLKRGDFETSVTKKEIDSTEERQKNAAGEKAIGCNSYKNASVATRPVTASETQPNTPTLKESMQSPTERKPPYAHRSHSVPSTLRPVVAEKSSPKVKNRASRRVPCVLHTPFLATMPLRLPFDGQSFKQQPPANAANIIRTNASRSSPSIFQMYDLSRDRMEKHGIAAISRKRTSDLARSCPTNSFIRERPNTSKTAFKYCAKSASQKCASKAANVGLRNKSTIAGKLFEDEGGSAGNSARSSLSDVNETSSKSQDVPDDSDLSKDRDNFPGKSTHSSFTRSRSLADLPRQQRSLADVDPAAIYSEHLRLNARNNTLLTPEQLVIRESVEKVQRWIKTLPRHFDTIHHVLPPVRQDY